MQIILLPVVIQDVIVIDKMLQCYIKITYMYIQGKKYICSLVSCYQLEKKDFSV